MREQNPSNYREMQLNLCIDTNSHQASFALTVGGETASFPLPYFESLVAIECLRLSNEFPDLIPGRQTII